MQIIGTFCEKCRQVVCNCAEYEAQKNKAIKEYKMKTLENKVFEALGEASMCWSETPKGVFDSTKAREIGDRLMRNIYNSENIFVLDTKLIPEDINVEEFIKNWKQQPLQIVQSKPSLQEAVEVLCNALREDYSYYISWQANIAMAFQDEFKNQEKNHNGFTRWLFLENGLHTISNKAAENFLNLLINK